MPGGGYGDGLKEMAEERQKAKTTGVLRIDAIIKMATDKKEGEARNLWACIMLGEISFHPISQHLVASVLTNMAKERGTADRQSVRDAIRAISERE